MKTRLLTFVAVLALVLASAPTALGYDTTNYAGRADTCYTNAGSASPCNGGTYDSSCHWTIYGRVNNRMVLFGPSHCFNQGLWGFGHAVYNGSGARLGVITSSNNGAGGDMTWMWLDSGQYPSTKNVIPGLWTNTTKTPNSLLSCSNMLAGGRNLDSLRMSYWNGAYEGPWAGQFLSAGSINQGSGQCEMRTNYDFGLGTKHVPSGAPLVDISLNGSGFVGGATECYSTCSETDDMMFSSWRQAIINLNNYWETHGTTYGAWFCSNSSCT